MGERPFHLGFAKGAASSFQSRIAGMALLTAVSVLVAASAVFILQQWMSDRTALRRHQTVVARVIAQQAAQLQNNHDPQWAQDALAPLAQTPNVGGAYLFAPGGKLVAAYGEDVGPALSASDEHFLQVRAPIVRAGQSAGEVVILSEGSSLGSIVARYASSSLALFFGATGLALFLAKWLAGRVTEPVRRLSGAMDQVAESGDFSQEVQPIAEDELGRLTDTFNGLLRKLNGNDQALRRTMAELMEARDAAEAANVLKSQFLANMSHEIRTPLNGVLAMAQIMDMGDLAQVQRERLGVVRQSGEALLAILNDVLDLSKIEAGKMELELAELELADIAQHVEAAYGEMAARKGLKLVVDLQDSARGRRQGDVGRLRQIASNLLSNAMKFTERGEVRLTMMGESQNGLDMLHMVVSDTGIGIPAEKAPLLFQKFTQVDSSTTRRFGGTGLGLAICRELAGLMGGRIWVESQEGEGSAFHLLAPLPKAHPAPISLPGAVGCATAEVGGTRPLRVLAAEDNATNQLVLRTIMQTFGVDLTMVADGRQAVDAWASGDFDLILMDIQMPVMDGVAATRTIREAEAQTLGKDGARRRIPIIALSANAMTHQVKEYLGVGMDMHVAKPIELGKLHAALRAVTADQDGRTMSGAAGAAA
jgi:signal transduction histidine kinase/AmiR/NasT family two-component response regulator